MRAASSSATSAASDGVLREEAAGGSASGTSRARDEYVEAMRAASKSRPRAASTAVHDKDGGSARSRLWQRLEARGALTLRVWQSLPPDRVDALRALGVRSRPRRPASSGSAT